MASNFPGLKDPRRQSRLGRLADRDVELGHAREWSRERLAAARRAEDEAATYKAATRRDIAGATESTGLGRAPSDALRENLEKALVKPSLLGMTAPLALSVPTTTAGKVIGGGIGAALGGIGGEDPYFSALSMLHPTLAMAQMVNAAYRDEPMLPITDAQGAGFPRRLIDLPGPARTARRYTPDERTSMLNELAPYARPRVLNPKASNILTSVLDDAVKQNETTVLYDRFNKPVSMYSMAGRGEPFDDSSYLSGLVSLNGPAGTGRQAAQHAARNSPLEGFRLFNTPTSKGFWDRIIETEPDWSLQYMPEHGLSAYRYLPPIKFAGGGSVAGAAKRFAQRAMSQAGDVDPVVAPRGALSVIKNKGGNWLTGSVEDSLSRLKVEGRRGHLGGELPPGMYDLGGDVVHILPDNSTRQWTPREHAINSWIDKQLTRYIKNEMATPEDPVRALAERGGLHFTPDPADANFSMRLGRAAANREEAGRDLMNVGQSPLAQQWEVLSDSSLKSMPAKYATGATLERNPWLTKVDPETLVYAQDKTFAGDPLNWNHLIDELSNALNTESGLPRHLLLDPSSLPRVSVPQAVERVSQINAWRAAQKAEADAAKANNLATVLHKEYPENNPLGLRWVELRAPELGELPEGYSITRQNLGATDTIHYLLKDPDGQLESFRSEEAARKYLQRRLGGQKLRDALSYEGDTMGHCVGGYCDDVLEGRSRIYSLRDAKGQPHVTIETRPTGITRDLEDEAIAAVAREHPDVEEGSDLMADLISAKLDALEAERFIAGDHQIIQIKGKQNRAPNPEYLPFVQDFVKSGQWSAVGDLRNAGMLEFRQPVTVRGDAREITIPTGRYAPEDLRQYFASPEVHPELSEAQLKAFLERQGFAAGGLARIAARTGKDAAPVRKGIGSIIKEKGGNWLTGSVEDALSVLRRTEDVPPVWDFVLESNTRGAALNSWIDKQLTRYIKNEMATPEDPVRALAERGILHFTPQDNSYLPGMARGMRARAGTPLDGVAQGPLAKHWENLSDYDIHTQPAGQLREHLETKVYPWLLKLPEETPVYQPTHSDSFTELGFDHLLDELSNAMNPDSGLPRNLQLDPKSMARVSVPQAVERVSAINAWRAAQKAEADALRANNAATVLFKEYPENNPLGLRWVELKARTKPGGGWKLDEHGFWENPEGARDSTWKDQAYSELKDALRYEGDTMGHCVGGYCDDVLSGRTKIYSLRDAKGQPHVTVEVAPQTSYGSEHLNAQRPQAEKEALEQGLDPDKAAYHSFIANRMDELAKQNVPPRIIQIKGKQNRKPNDEYLPFVQDFVKSGQWSDVGDLHNTGLKRFGGEYYLPSEMDDLAKARGQWKFTDSPDWETLPEILERLRPEYAAKYADPAQYEKEMTAHLLSKTGKTLGGEEWLNTDYFRLKPVEKATGGLVEAMIEQNLDALVEKQTPRQMSRGGSVRTPIRAKIEKMTSELRQCRN